MPKNEMYVALSSVQDGTPDELIGPFDDDDEAHKFAVNSVMPGSKWKTATGLKSKRPKAKYVIVSEGSVIGTFKTEDKAREYCKSGSLIANGSWHIKKMQKAEKL